MFVPWQSREGNSDAHALLFQFTLPGTLPQGMMPSTFKEAFSSSDHPFWKSPLTMHKEVSLIHAGGVSSLDQVDS